MSSPSSHPTVAAVFGTSAARATPASPPRFYAAPDAPFYGWDRAIESDAAIAAAEGEPLPYGDDDFELQIVEDPTPLARWDDQKSMGSCRGASGSSCGEILRGYATGEPATAEAAQFSKLGMYLLTQERDGWIGRDAGASIARGIEVMKEVGFIPEALLPYPNPVRYPRNARAVVTAEMRAAASAFRVQRSQRVRNYAEARQWIGSGQGPVDFGTFFNGSWSPTGGVLESVRRGIRDGGHAMTFGAVGPKVDARGRNYLWLLNSHYNFGWVQISPTAVDYALSHPAGIAFGLSDLTVPNPRRISFATHSLYGPTR